LFVENAYTFKDALAGVSDKNKIDFKQAIGLKSRIMPIDTGNGGKVYLLIARHWFSRLVFCPRDFCIRYAA
jgi:hypothetical protein